MDELRRRGHLTLDTDYDGWVLADGLRDEPRMIMFLRDHADVFVAGAADNQGRFYNRFQQSASVELVGQRSVTELADILEALAGRTQ